MGQFKVGQWSRIRANENGATAIEFAMIGPLLFSMIFSLLELSWLIVKMLIVNNAVEVAAKKIYTGQVPDRAAFEALVCDNMSLISNCADNVNVEAIQLNGFGDLPDNEAECRDSGDDDFNPSRQYTTGTASALMFVRVCVTTELFTPGLGISAALPKQPNGSFAVVSSTVFVNEPF